jgi:hypothetical protein
MAGILVNFGAMSLVGAEEFDQGKNGYLNFP